MTRKQFRTLLLIYVALIVASAIAAFMPGAYSPALSDAIDKEPAPWLLEDLWRFVALGLPLVVAAFAGMYGLYTFRRWGRTLSLYTTVAGLLLYPLMGPSVSGGVETAIYEAVTLMWGAILALAYYSPVAAEFNAASASSS